MLTKIECTLCENIFGRYCVPKSSQHRPACQELLRGGVWELETIDFIRRHAGDRDIVHAGTYFGDFLPGLASALASGRTIYGFEPNPENYTAAQWTAVLNALTNVRLTNVGLGAERKGTFMRIASTGRKGAWWRFSHRQPRRKALGGGSQIVDDWSAAPPNDGGVSPIRLVTLDDALPLTADVGILQLDVEGYEASALMGGLQTIQRCRPIIIVETVPTAFVAEYLVPLGYSHTETICENSVFTPQTVDAA
jgi:FkbM family methyltransferase